MFFFFQYLTRGSLAAPWMAEAPADPYPCGQMLLSSQGGSTGTVFLPKICFNKQAAGAGKHACGCTEVAFGSWQPPPAWTQRSFLLAERAAASGSLKHLEKSLGKGTNGLIPAGRFLLSSCPGMLCFGTTVMPSSRGSRDKAAGRRTGGSRSLPRLEGRLEGVLEARVNAHIH